jgi:hypothetical protein
VTRPADEFREIMLDLLHDAREELGRQEYVDLLWLLGEVALRRISDTWSTDPDVPFGWT